MTAGEATPGKVELDDFLRGSLLSGLLVLLAWAPLPLASNRPFAWALLALAIGIMSMFLGLFLLARRDAVALPKLKNLLFLWPFLAFLALCSLQVLPGLGGNNAYWSSAAQVLGGVEPHLSIAPDETLASIIRLSAYGLLFLMIMFLTRDPRWAHRFLWGILMIVLTYCLYGLIVFAMGNEKVLWLEKWAFHNSLTSTFVNRDAFAVFAGFGIIIGSAIWLKRQSDQRLHFGLRQLGAFRLIFSLGWESLVLLVCVAVCALAVVLTNSRDGLISVGASLTALSLLLRQDERYSKFIRSYGMILLVLLISTLILSGDDLLQKLQNSRVEEARQSVVALGGQAFAEYPLFGYGLGSFIDIFHAFRSLEFGDMQASMDKAHNTYLEILVETGLVGALLLYSALAIVLFRLARDFFLLDGDRMPQIVGLAATSLVAVHSIIDFSLQVPAVALTYAALLGVACGQTFSLRERRERAKDPLLLDEEDLLG